ncbi:MAG: hypothetical protein CMM01_11375 [Rhodopirellula sp.]|nr:hypothetical protein [Rhodopirellula sp.]
MEATLALAQQKTSLRAQFITKKSTNARFGLSPAEAGFFVRAPRSFCPHLPQTEMPTLVHAALKSTNIVASLTGTLSRPRIKRNT